nr:hypothetical protein [Tanacetum cinerariifolium]
MRIEQYFLMTDYSLWEVILYGDSSVPTRVVDGVLQPVAPTTAKHRLARKNELKARGTLLMALPDKHQLKFNYHKDAKTLTQEIKKSLPSEWRTHTLIWRNKTDLEEQSLDDLFNSLKIYEAEVKSSYSAGPTAQNIAFVSSSNIDSTTEPVSVVASVSIIYEKMPVFSLPNVDSLSNAVIYSFFASQSSSPQLDNKDLNKIDTDDLKEMDLKWKIHFVRECRSPKDSRRNSAAEPQRRNVPAKTSTSNALVSQCTTTQNIAFVSSFNTNITNEPVSVAACVSTVCAKMHVSSLLNIDADNLKEMDLKWYQSGKGYHVVPPPYTGTFMPPKPDLVFNNAPNDVVTDHSAFNVKLSPTKPDQDFSHTNRPSAPIIKDWVSDYEDESKTKTPQNVPSFVQPTEQVKSPRPYVQHVETSIPTATPKPASPKPTSNGKRKNRKACIGNPQHTLKDKKVIDSGCSRHMTRNMSYLSDFEELNGEYVAFEGNQKGGKISRKGKFEGNVDEGFLVGYSVNSKAFRVFNSRTRIIQETLHVNFLENKPNVEGTGPTWLFDIDSLTRTMNCQPVTTGNQTNPSAGFQKTFDADKVEEEANLQYVIFLVWFTGSSNPQNNEGDAAFDEKEHDAKNPKSAVNLSPSRSALSGEKHDMTKKKDKGKTPVEYFSEYRDLKEVFEDFSEDSSNDVSAAGPIVPTARQNYSNSTNLISVAGSIVPTTRHNYSNRTNPISAVGPSNSNSSPTHGQSSLRNTYQPPDMVEREDIVYSDYENVGAEADFNNLETSITVSPIPITRTHNAHLIS